MGEEEDISEEGTAALAAERFGINNRLEPGYDMITCVSTQ